MMVLLALSVSIWPVRGQADPALPSPYVPQSASASSFDAQLSGINNSVSSLLSQKYVPPSGVKPIAPAPSAVHVVPLQNNEEMRTIIGAEQTAAIKSAAYKLYNQGAAAVKRQPPPVITGGVAPQVMTISSAPPQEQLQEQTVTLAPPSFPGYETAPVENKTLPEVGTVAPIEAAQATGKAEEAVVAKAEVKEVVATKKDVAVAPEPQKLEAVAAKTEVALPAAAPLEATQATVKAEEAVVIKAEAKEVAPAVVPEVQKVEAVAAKTEVALPAVVPQEAVQAKAKAEEAVAVKAEAKEVVAAKKDVAIAADYVEEVKDTTKQAAVIKPALQPDPSVPEVKVKAAKVVEPIATVVANDKVGNNYSAHPVERKNESVKDMERAPKALHLDGEDNSAAEDAAFLRKIAGTDKLLLADGGEEDHDAIMGDPVALTDSVIYALKNNYEVKAGEAGLRSVWWDKLGAYSEYMPSVAYSYAQGAERSAPASINDSLGNRVLENTHFRRDRGLSVQQPLLDLSILSDIFSAEDKEDIAKENHKDQREGIASDTINAYMKVMQSRIAMSLADQYKGYLDNLLKRMTERVQGGAGTAADLDRIKSRSTMAESARIEAAGQYQTDLSEYTRLTKITPSQIMIPTLLAPPVPEDSTIALAGALRNNPSYLNALNKMNLADDDRNKGYAGLLPKLSVQYAKAYSHGAGGSAKGNPVDGVYPDQTTESIMFVAQWSLNGGTKVATALSASAKGTELDYRAQDSRARLEQAIHSSYTAINAAKERRRALKKNVEENERVVSGFEEQYTAGTRSLFDLLDAYEQLYNSRVNLMRVIIAGTQVRYSVHRQMGQLISSIVDEDKK